MIEAAVADVIGPAVSADDPDAFLDEQVGKGKKLFRVVNIYSNIYTGVCAAQLFF